MPKKEITLKVCPICGSAPKFRAEDMSGPNYQHYYGCTDYIYECPNCEEVSASACDVYSSNEAAQQNAKKNWNKLCEAYEKKLAWRNKNLKDTIQVSRVAVESAKRRVDNYLNIENSDYARGELSILDDILEGRFTI